MEWKSEIKKRWLLLKKKKIESRFVLHAEYYNKYFTLDILCIICILHVFRSSNFLINVWTFIDTWIHWWNSTKYRKWMNVEICRKWYST